MQTEISRFADALPGLVWTAHPDGTVDFLNRGCLDYAGLGARASLNESWQAAIHPEDRPKHAEFWKSSVGYSSPAEFQLRLLRGDGQYRWFRLRIRPLLDERGGVEKWCGQADDIDDLVRATAALSESERNLEQLIDGIPGYVSVADAKGRHIYSSKPARARSKRTLEQLSGLGFINSIHPEEQEMVKAEWLRCVALGIAMELHHRLSIDGLYRWFHVRVEPFHGDDGRVLRWYGLLTDVDDQRRMEAALRQSEQHLRLIVETIPAVVTRWTADGVLDFVNRRGRDYFKEELSRVGADVMHPDDWDKHSQSWASSLQSGEAFEHTHRLRGPDGEYRWFYERVQPLRGPDGSVTCWYSVNIDIHSTRQVEEALRATTLKLTDAMQMAAVAQMSATIAHEISQPLSGILTNASTCMRMLTAKTLNLEGAKETARRAIRDAERASAVISRLRALFAKETTSTAPLDLNEAARQVVALSQAELQRSRVTVRMDMDESIPVVIGDRVQLQQVILNLVLNAAESMREVNGRKRTLLIKTGREVDGGVRLAVQDVGTGLDLNGLERLFEPFYTTKSSGMGMGLSVSRSIIENHHGLLVAAANEGPGATFSFCIPVGSSS